MTTSSPSTVPPHAASILAFWLADGLDNWPPGALPAQAGRTPGWPSQDMNPRWFGGGTELDRQISQAFGSLLTQAMAGELAAWESNAPSCLALVILLDQFSRNIHRGTAQAFASDALAQRLCTAALAQGMDQQLPWVGRVFMYMPLMHAENLALQDEGVRRFAQLVEDVPEALHADMASRLDFARQHRDIIADFGRFPYRNAVLSRSDTAPEREFIKNGPRFGQ